MMRQRSGTETDSRGINGVGGGTCFGSIGGNSYLSGTPCGRSLSTTASSTALSFALTGSAEGAGAAACVKLLACVAPNTATTISFITGRLSVDIDAEGGREEIGKLWAEYESKHKTSTK